MSAGVKTLGEQTAALGTNVAAFVTHYLQHWQPYRPFWNYEDGCIYKGALDLHVATKLPIFFDFAYREVSARVAADGTIRNYKTDEFNIDHINSGKVLFTLFEMTGEGRFRRAIESQAAQLERHPRTKSGNYWHKAIYPHQVWLDGLYMAQPFQVALARLAGKPELARDTARQFAHVHAVLRDKATGLYRHGWDESRGQRWADPATGRSAHAWGRAMGWFAMALVDCLALGDAFDARDRTALIELFRDVMSGLMRVRSANGLWHQVLDARERAGNYEETSASLMIAYALMKGARLGLLGPKESIAGVAACRHAIDRFLTPTELGGICAVAGLGGQPYRDGSFAYYLSEPVVANDPKGVGALFMAVSEAIRGNSSAVGG